MDVLWFRPDKPENISVGRQRIADILRGRGHDVSVRNATIRAFSTGLTGSPDVIVGTTRLGAAIGIVRKVVQRTPLVVDHIDPISQFRSNRGPLAGWGVSQMEHTAFRLADHVMVVYEEELPRVERHARGVTKTHLGVDYERFALPGTDAIEYARNVLAERTYSERKRVIYVGGLEPTYNIPAIVNAMEHLDGWDFIVLGDGSQREFIEQLDRDDVHYLGSVSHDRVPGFLHESDVGICLVDDPHTLKVLEYGAAGLPTVNVEGKAEQRFGQLVEFCSLDPEDVARAIRCASDSVDVDEFQTYTRRFSWESIADQYEDVLLRVTGKA